LKTVKCYISHPKQEAPKNAILYIPDAFGLELSNNKLLADALATAGYLVVIPDIYNANPVPETYLTEGPSAFDLYAWLPLHTPETVEPILDAVIKALRSEHGVERLGAVGYCFGAKYVVRYLAPNRGVDAGFIAHPSFVTPEEVGAIAGPLSIAAAETDGIFPAELRRKVEDVLMEKKLTYESVLYGGVEHGFAVRTDLSVKEKKFAKEGAYFQAVRWLDEFVKVQ
jgi:dienelactone hydrolase